MKNVITSTIIFMFLSGCIPDNLKEKMNEGMASAQQIMGDMEFKKALAHIELHKLRNGSYPNSLSELQFLSAMDSSILENVEYTRLDSVYELNLIMEFPTLNGKKTTQVSLKYPPEFWKGLGCARSNLK